MRLRPLAASVALILCTTAPAAMAAATHLVTTCNDQLPLTPCSAGEDGTLRHAYSCAADGDTIDLTQLQCSKITLSDVLFNLIGNITLNGPGREKLTIEAASRRRVIAHGGNGTDTLTINGLTLANGFNNSVGGGCIYSTSNVRVNSSAVTGCYALAPTATTTAGGAMLAKGEITVVDSNIYSNVAKSLSAVVSEGGGIKAYAVHLVNSNVTRNSATYGGGVFAQAFESENSTISYNYARSDGGVFADKALLIVNSTISGNGASSRDGGVRSDGTAAIYNSTIAFNTAAVGAGGLTARSLYLQSSIVARNTVAMAASDLGSPLSRIGVRFTGAHNLIMTHESGITVPDDTIIDDPQLLRPFRDNGGPTFTLALLPGSPAIDHGANFTQQPFDQRGVPRVIGSSADIGAFESDYLFTDGFDP
jgi:hypothetical protein